MGRSTDVPPRHLQYTTNYNLIDWLIDWEIKNDAHFTESLFWTQSTLGLTPDLVPKKQNTIFQMITIRILWIDRETKINCAEVHYFRSSVHHSIKQSSEEPNILSFSSKSVLSLEQNAFCVSSNVLFNFHHFSWCQNWKLV